MEVMTDLGRMGRVRQFVFTCRRKIARSFGNLETSSKSVYCKIPYLRSMPYKYGITIICAGLANIAGWAIVGIILAWHTYARF